MSILCLISSSPVIFQDLYCVRSDLGNLLKALGRLDEAKVGLLHSRNKRSFTPLSLSPKIRLYVASGTIPPSLTSFLTSPRRTLLNLKCFEKKCPLSFLLSLLSSLTRLRCFVGPIVQLFFSPSLPPLFFDVSGLEVQSTQVAKFFFFFLPDVMISKKIEKM